MVEWCNLLDCDFGTSLSVSGRDDDTVGSFSNDIDYLVCGTYSSVCASIDGQGYLPTLNLTFLGADADDPFVVFSWGTPCVLATLDCMANKDRIM
jgi:hypothetical protein